jgi:hypothetical protein
MGATEFLRCLQVRKLKIRVDWGMEPTSSEKIPPPRYSDYPVANPK